MTEAMRNAFRQPMFLHWVWDEMAFRRVFGGLVQKQDQGPAISGLLDYEYGLRARSRK